MFRSAIIRCHPPGRSEISKCRDVHRVSSTRTLTTQPGHPPQAGYTELCSRRLISIYGPDVVTFLQGAITANISEASANTVSGGFFAAFLNARGRVVNDVFIYRDKSSSKADSWLIEVDAKEAQNLLRWISTYKLRARLKARLVDVEERKVYACWRDGVEGWTAHKLAGSLPEVLEAEPTTGCRDTRAPGMGWRVVTDGGHDSIFQNASDQLRATTETMYKVRRYLKGVAEGQDEIIYGEALPQDSNLDYMGGIDYRKGCYVGQELTIRTHHTGVVRRRILPLTVYGADDPIPHTLEWRPKLAMQTETIPRGTKISSSTKSGRAPGKWLSGIGNLGLGLCRIDAMTDVRFQGEPGTFKHGDEFVLETQNHDLKAKAFVPSWHLTRPS